MRKVIDLKDVPEERRLRAVQNLDYRFPLREYGNREVIEILDHQALEEPIIPSKKQLRWYLVNKIRESIPHLTDSNKLPNKVMIDNTIYKEWNGELIIANPFKRWYRSAFGRTDERERP